MSQLRKTIDEKKKFRSEIVTVPKFDGFEDWEGVQVKIRSVSAGRRGKFLEVAKPDRDGNVTGNVARTQFELCAEACLDPDTDERVWRDNEFAAFAEIPPPIADFLFQQAVRMSGFNRAEQLAGKGASSSPTATSTD